MWWVVNKQEKRLIDCFAEKDQCAISLDQEWLEVPEHVLPGNCKVHTADDGSLSLVGSEDKNGPKWDALRITRNALLAGCDWTQGMDSPLTSEVKSSWASYRQSLRDLPQQNSDPDNASWPRKPS